MAGIRVYADTSVYGGAFDEEFAEASRSFFDQVRAGRFRLIVSPIVNFQKIPLYNGVNLASGYGVVGIHTPQEVIAYEDEDI